MTVNFTNILQAAFSYQRKGGGVKLPTFRTEYDAATMWLSCIPYLGNSVLENKELEGKKWKVLCRGRRRDSKSWKTEKETESA